MPNKAHAPKGAESNRVRKQGGNNRPSFRTLNDESPIWDSVPAEVIHALVCMSTTQGASPTFGYTRNGSSLTLALYWKGERSVEYLSDSGEVQEYVTFLAKEWFQLSDEEMAEYSIGPRLMD